MTKTTNFFDRLSELSDLKGFKNVRSLALDGLGYKSYEKLNRLKDSNNKPSINIIEDIANLFDDVSLDWLVLGKGNIIIDNQQQPTVTNSNTDSKLEDLFADYLGSPKAKKVINQLIAEHMIGINSMIKLLVLKDEITKELDSVLDENLKTHS